MEIRTLLDFMAVAEKLKCRTRHSWTSDGRRESVAEHTYRLLVFAWLVKEEFPDYDMERVQTLCLFHDLGEALTGDIPCFEKGSEDEKEEEAALQKIAQMLPDPYQDELLDIFREVLDKRTKESRLVQALDKTEAVIQHNEAPIDSWVSLEYELQQIYGQEQTKEIPYMKKLREVVLKDTLTKIKLESPGGPDTGKEFFVSSDSRKLSLVRVTELLRQTSWAKDRPKELIREAMENSRSYGVYDRQERMVGYGRVITDSVTTFYLCDVVIDEAYRNRGLGTLLMDQIMEDAGHLHGMLHTDNAAGFYEKYGFKVKNSGDETFMEKERDFRSI